MNAKHPFFIVGPGRSGTTLLYHALAAHPRVALTNEAHLPLFFSLCIEFAKSRDSGPLEINTERGRIEVICPVNPEYFGTLQEIFVKHSQVMIEEFFRRWFADRDFTHWGDKMPSTPREQVEIIRHFYPTARFVALFRDPRDYVASHVAAARERPGFAGRDPAGLAQHWSRQAELWSGAPRTHLLRYEDLMANPREHVEEISRFLDLEPDSAVEEALAAREAVRARNATSESASRSLGRWRTDLEASEIELIESECGSIAAKLGYELS